MINNCIVCNSDSLKFFLKKDDYDIYKCQSCGLVFVNDMPSNLENHYSAGYFNGDLKLDGYMDYEEEKQASQSTYSKYLDLLERSCGDSRRLFEIGCATGYFLELARFRNWDVSGLDISEYAVVEAKKKGLAVSVGTPMVLKGCGIKKDVVVMLDVFEHLNDLKNDIKVIRDILCDNGFLVISTPDSGGWWSKLWGKKWHAIVPPQHLNLFSHSNIIRFLEDNNFEIVSINHYGKRFTLPYIARLFYTWTRWKIWMYLANGLARISFLRNFSIPINLGDTMFLIAKKI